LDVGSKAVKSALEGILGGRVHHAGLEASLALCFIAPTGVEKLTYCGASSGTQEMNATLR
jgi:hypothetical protein